MPVSDQPLPAAVGVAGITRLRVVDVAGFLVVVSVRFTLFVAHRTGELSQVTGSVTLAAVAVVGAGQGEIVVEDGL